MQLLDHRGIPREAAEIEVFQGEDDDVRRNHRIGQFMIEGLSRVPAVMPGLAMPPRG